MTHQLNINTYCFQCPKSNLKTSSKAFFLFFIKWLQWPSPDYPTTKFVKKKSVVGVGCCSHSLLPQYVSCFQRWAFKTFMVQRKQWQQRKPAKTTPRLRAFSATTPAVRQFMESHTWASSPTTITAEGKSCVPGYDNNSGCASGDRQASFLVPLTWQKDMVVELIRQRLWHGTSSKVKVQRLKIKCR